MDQARAIAAIAHNPLGHPWGSRCVVQVPYRTGLDGKGRCRWCDGDLPPRRSSWCGQPCVDAFTMRSHWGTLRLYVLRRDAHRCRECGEHGHEVDHTAAVVEGGTDNPQNLRLLCTSCHKKATAELARRRAAARRSIGLPLGVTA